MPMAARHPHFETVWQMKRVAAWAVLSSVPAAVEEWTAAWPTTRVVAPQQQTAAPQRPVARADAGERRQG